MAGHPSSRIANQNMNCIKSWFVILLLSSLCLSSCFQYKPDIAKCWFYTFESGFKATSESGLTPASFLCLQKDGTYTRDFGVFDYGHWSYKDLKLHLASQRSQSTDLNIQSLGFNEMTVDMDGGKINFDGQVLATAKDPENPFSLENNKWRIPAAQKEDSAALCLRLRNHCRFWEVYFTWALDTKQEIVDVRSTPTPIKIYGNGFALKPVKDEPARWRTYFFDEEDCAKANRILDDAIRNHDIALAHTDNKFKMFIGAFQQLEDVLK
jgi:hypothetical protein